MPFVNDRCRGSSTMTPPLPGSSIDKRNGMCVSLCVRHFEATRNTWTVTLRHDPSSVHTSDTHCKTDTIYDQSCCEATRWKASLASCIRMPASIHSCVSFEKKVTYRSQNVNQVHFRRLPTTGRKKFKRPTHSHMSSVKLLRRNNANKRRNGWVRRWETNFRESLYSVCPLVLPTDSPPDACCEDRRIPTYRLSLQP